MIDSMFALESDFGSARAAYLLERFDEKKIKLDDTQYYFYLSTHIKYALYKKDEFLTKKYRDEFNNKYSAINNNYFGLDDEEFIFDEEEL